MSVQDTQTIEHILQELKDHPAALQMKHFTQHGGVSTYQHCENVVKLSYLLNKYLHLGADKQAMLTGAFLHDFCLYDWHDGLPEHRLHGYRHAERARKNAVAYFHIGEKEQHIIWCHMWPLNVTRVPRNREAWIVCFADKICAVYEALFLARQEKLFNQNFDCGSQDRT